MSALPREEWERLREMRAGFLASEERAQPSAAPDYFRAWRDVELYDATFAQRIGWKWNAALREVAHREPTLRPASVVDWACGSGAATRALLTSPVGQNVRSVRLWDRSRRAMEYAREALLEVRPELQVLLAPSGEPTGADLFLASHVLDELDTDGEAALERALRGASAAIVLESGTRASSRRLGGLRARLLGSFTPIAPCTHAASCGALARPDDWCHFFARPPAEVFRDAFWSEFARELGVDLRSLAYSFIALAKSPATQPTGLHRILGRPRMLKGRALVDACSASGVATLSLLERIDRKLFKSLDEASNEPRLWRIELDGERIRSLTEH
jgi:SAM-dependent methyltransferase